MRINALSVANYFIELAHMDGLPLTQLGLMKRVYAAHGFSLALLNFSLLDHRFDHVEAWKYGPVIPSVYHSFKCYKNNPITTKTIIVEWDERTRSENYITPELNDNRARSIVQTVWNRYKDYSDSEMVALTHKEGTPWALCYQEGKNNEIPDAYTKLYYEKLVKNIVNT
ncbi:MAG: Panacea domain-containing protein [Bacteroides fragilis]|jgi:uncharacterized phage-associated protein|uniref:Panacea domain-containing protein n=1 Tax=Bacteroides fragilis TaxID=817 RepID=UPI0021624107|nr:type II toxin-antitoxin system antitoxin SocA domain-containing protein [Bacteroides fragilis]MCZ2552280.1 DUF4065 domain-containing protein [Bacteroides fragilis]UVP05677.1 DUF4065 domain-containing protein [Bacteroides fragilis]UVP97000.1 DUF4065 domain-containing protein [Bacteroides fragilis]